jgi:NAD(P)-dependent dehydrogenase (short-subunit alcohol dehydrogenase family)
MARNVPRKSAVVTGAGSGIGRAVAGQLLQAGHGVLAVDLNASAAGELEAAGAIFLQADVASETGRSAIVSSAKQLPSVDYLVNAAGIIVIGRPLQFSLEDWRRVFAVNVEGTYFLCQGLATLMPKGGAIVNISSSSAKLATTIEAAPYAATKAAVLSITRSLAYTLAPKQIRVNAICPGIVDTPMERSVNEKVGAIRGISMEQLSAARDASVPLGRGASADECAAAILFLLSDQAGYITGEGMNFSGGQVVW